jgi:hypothetical protein
MLYICIQTTDFLFVIALEHHAMMISFAMETIHVMDMEIALMEEILAAMDLFVRPIAWNLK